MMKYTSFNKIKLFSVGFLRGFHKCEIPRRVRGYSVSQNYLSTETSPPELLPGLVFCKGDLEKLFLDRLHASSSWRIRVLPTEPPCFDQHTSSPNIFLSYNLLLHPHFH